MPSTSCSDNGALAAPSTTVRRAIQFYSELLSGGYAASTVECLDRAVEDHDVPLSARTDRKLLRPAMVSSAAYAAVSAKAAAIVRSLSVATDHLLRDRSLRQRVGLPAYLEPLLQCSAIGQHSTIGRLDGFIDASGAFTVLEYNSAPQGFSGNVELNRAFARMPIARAFEQRFAFRWDDTFGAAYRAVLTQFRERGGRGTPAIGAVGQRVALNADPENRWLPYLAARGCKVVSATVGECEQRDGRLLVAGMPVDMVALLDWRDIVIDPRRLEPIVRAAAGGHLQVVNGLAEGLLSGYKSTLAMLSDPEYRRMFPRALWSTLDTCIPWTRVVRECSTTVRGEPVDLLEHLSAHRRDYVLKPSGGNSGGGVLLGAESSDDEWNRVLRFAHGNYVAQARVRPPTVTWPIAGAHGWAEADVVADCCPFVWNGRESSCWLVRAAREGALTNVAAGGMGAAVWIIQDDGAGG